MTSKIFQEECTWKVAMPTSLMNPDLSMSLSWPQALTFFRFISFWFQVLGDNVLIKSKDTFHARFMQYTSKD